MLIEGTIHQVSSGGLVYTGMWRFSRCSSKFSTFPSTRSLENVLKALDVAGVWECRVVDK